MKRIDVVFLLLLICNSSFSQIADTSFGESKNSVMQKVENRFGYPDSNDDASIVYWNKMYAGHEWDYITFDFKTDDSGETHLSYNALNKDYITLESAKQFLFNLKANLSYSFIQAKKEENVSFSYEAKENNTDIELYIYYNKGERKKYSVWLTYQVDTLNYKEQDLNSAIMFTNFGDTYEDTKSILSSKYGYPFDYDREVIVYKDVVFAGLKWDIAYFSFTYTSSTSHLTSIMLSKGCYTADDVKRERENILHKKINPEEWEYKTNDNGFKMYRVDKDDKSYYIIVNKKSLGYPYTINVMIKSKLYNTEDKL